MFAAIDIEKELHRQKIKSFKNEDIIIDEVNKLFSKNLYEGKNVLTNLKSYNNSFAFLDETNLDKNYIYSPKTLKKICILLRLKFLDNTSFKFDVPYEASLKINDLNNLQGKDLQGFKILGEKKSFFTKNQNANFAIFAPTLYGNYYLIHKWGSKLKWHKKLFAFPVRNFECLSLSVILFTLTVTLSLPTFLITLDKSATYFCSYRIAVFFHLLIFFSGFTAYYLVGFNKPFSDTSWKDK